MKLHLLVGSSSLLARAQDDADIVEGEDDADVADETVLGEDSIQEEMDSPPTDAAKTDDKVNALLQFLQKKISIGVGNAIAM